MITSVQCFARYGDPKKENNMALWDVPEVMERSAIPGRIYCNKDMQPALAQAIGNLITRRCIDEMKTWDGCFNIRSKKGGESASLHSWGLAVDINANWNKFGATPKLSAGFVQCFKDAGFDWGGDWSYPDGMHFQMKEFPVPTRTKPK